MKHPELEGRPLLIGDKVRAGSAYDGAVIALSDTTAALQDGKGQYHYGVPITSLTRVPPDWRDEHADAIRDARAVLVSGITAAHPLMLSGLAKALLAAVDAFDALDPS